MLKQDGRKTYPWIMAAGIVLLVIWACILIEMGVTVYKTVKYAEKG